MQLVRSRAGVGDTNVEALYFLAIASARESLDLTAAYFAPRPAFIEALCDAADRGVDVRVLVPGPHIDKEFVRQAGRARLRAAAGLRRAGLRVPARRCCTPRRWSLDGAWSSVGSVNFDNRSFQLHDEATLCVRSERFAALLTEQFERDLEVSDEIEPGRWRDRTRRQRATEAGAGPAREREL